MFIVGDAAGQCLPLTAEGIRPSFYFGEQCGLIVQRVIDGGLSLGEGLTEYRRRVLAYRWAYRRLRWARYARFGRLQERRAQRTDDIPAVRG